ncbi:MAG: CDP-alcohol phosphatidyltransferase family protein [Gammaproteobacteria bacterium]|nr:CDP-alcohol phosphatidyltransferase family protein [Gammaproteobacteria bacterium]
MNYIELVKKIKDINSSQITNIYTFDALLRFISYFVTPIFYYLKMSPNAVTYTSAIVGFGSAAIGIIYGIEYIVLVILLFYLHLVIDYCDGNVARLLNKTSFFGRFIDGLFNVLVVSGLQIALFVMISDPLHAEHFKPLAKIPILYIELICLISIALYPVQHLIYDRYSAYIRWVNQEHRLDIFPSIKSAMSFKTIHLFDNLHYLTLILSIYNISFILLNFIINIILSFALIYFHIKYSYINMNVSASKYHRVKKEEGIGD